MFKKIGNIFCSIRERQLNGFPVEKHLPNVQEEAECKNCGEHFSGAFCPKCGQSASVKRINVRESTINIIAGFLAGDDIFFRTCRDLLWRPGYMIYDYLSGKRAGYFKPVHLLVRLVAIYVLIVLIFGLRVEEIKLVDGVDVHSNALVAILPLLTKLMNNKVFSSLIQVFFSVIPFWCMFRFCNIRREDAYTKKLNIAEHFFALVFLNCALMIFAFPSLCIGLDSSYKTLADNIELLLAVFFPIWGYRQLYNISWIRSTLLTVTAMLITAVLVVFVVALTFGIFYGIEEAVK